MYIRSSIYYAFSSRQREEERKRIKAHADLSLLSQSEICLTEAIFHETHSLLIVQLRIQNKSVSLFCQLKRTHGRYFPAGFIVYLH